MTRKPPQRLPITPATVSINGTLWSAKSDIWAGLFFHLADVRDYSIWSKDDHNLRVPWAHVDDIFTPDDCYYRVRSRDPAYRFVKARNGAWVLERPE